MRQPNELQQALDQHLAEAQTLNVDLAEKSTENDVLTQRLAEMETAFEALKVSMQEQEIKLPALRQQFEETTCAKKRLEQEVKDREKDLGEARASVNVRFEELATLTKMLEEREGELVEKTNRVNEKEGQVKKLSTELAGLTDALKDAAEEQVAFTRQLAQMDVALKAKDMEIEAQRQRVAKLKATVSWKITAPVRAIARPFRKASKNTDPIKKQVALIKQSGLFDENWYLEQYPDVAQNGGDPVEHYVRHGISEQRNPGQNFDVQ